MKEIQRLGYYIWISHTPFNLKTSPMGECEFQTDKLIILIIINKTFIPSVISFIYLKITHMEGYLKIYTPQLYIIVKIFHRGRVNFKWSCPFLPEVVIQIAIFHVLEYHKIRFLLHTNSVKSNDIVMLQVCQQFRFSLKVFPRITHWGVFQGFDGNHCGFLNFAIYSKILTYTKTDDTKSSLA